jgi:hypothetical protein
MEFHNKARIGLMREKRIIIKRKMLKKKTKKLYSALDFTILLKFSYAFSKTAKYSTST